MDGNKRKAQLPGQSAGGAEEQPVVGKRRPLTAPAKSREAVIAELAYFRALRRGFEPGHEAEDWFEAEAESGKSAARLAITRADNH